MVRVRLQPIHCPLPDVVIRRVLGHQEGEHLVRLRLSEVGFRPSLGETLIFGGGPRAAGDIDNGLTNPMRVGELVQEGVGHMLHCFALFGRPKVRVAPQPAGDGRVELRGCDGILDNLQSVAYRVRLQHEAWHFERDVQPARNCADCGPAALCHAVLPVQRSERFTPVSLHLFHRRGVFRIVQVAAGEDSEEQIAHLGRVPVLAIVPDEPDNSVQEATIGPDTQFAIDQVPWKKIIRIDD